MRMRGLCFVFLILSFVSFNVLAQGPPMTSDPDFRLIEGFDAPGEFPITVTATNMNITPVAGAEVDGFDEDVFRAEFPAAGPIKWTSSRMNAGDIALSIGPAFPDNPLSYPSGDPGNQNNFQAMNDDFASIDPNSTELTTLSWRVSQRTGAHFATTRHNGVDDGYVLDASNAPVGAIRGITYVSGFGGRQGWGFSMDTGAFENGGGSSTELHLGHAGDAFGGSEAVYDIASAYFPYEQGWKGAWVDGATDGPAFFDGSSPDVDESEVTWSAGQATIQLTGVDSATDGMLFVAPASGSSTSRIAAGHPNGNGGWTTTVRLDADLDTTGQTYEDGERFQFLYVPYDANNLVGGQVDGETGNMVNSAGDISFTLTRTASGDFSLSVFESDGVTKKTDDSGMLLLSVADSMAGNATLGSRAFMSYEYDASSGDFIINSREFIDIDTSNPDAQDGFGNVFAGSDSDFYFTWVDFTNPLSLGGGPSGDFSGDGAWDCDDINALTAAIAAGSTDSSFDMNGDGQVSIEDITDPSTGWLAVGGANNPDATQGNAFLVGDANLDGVVDVGDFNLWNGSKFTSTDAWCLGDFTADGVVDVSDFNEWNASKFTSSADTAAVPEPASGLMIIWLMGVLFAARTRL